MPSLGPTRPKRTTRTRRFGSKRRPKGHRVKKVKPCRHPGLPKTTLPQEPDGQDADEPAPEPRPLILISPSSYGATPLLNMTCGHFLHCELQPHQTAARDAFVKCYLEASPRGTAWDKLPAQRVQSFEEGSGSKLDEAEGAFLEGSLRSMMKYLDEYFFFGTMTRLQEGQQYLLLALETGFGRLKADVAEGRYGDTQIYRTHWDNTDQPYARVRLWSRLACDSPQSRDGGRRIRRLSFARNVATLIHELVHAYLGIFVCAGAQCRRNILNTTGVTGHASTFTKLYALVLGEVREWHPELGSLNKHECIPGTSIVSHNIAFEAAARQQWRSDGRDRGLLPLRADSPRNLVRQTEEVINGISVMSITYRRPGSRIPGQEEADGSCDVDGV